MLLRIAFLVCLLLVSPWMNAAADERRIALVVGVSNYKHAPQLANTLNDARDMAKTLERLGFDVEHLTDPDRSAFEAGVRRLGQRARDASASLFYFAGHALELGGRNWLIPISADIQAERDLRFEALDLDSVLEQMESSSRTSILLIDACRENPFRMRLAAGRDLPTRGLARVSPGAGTFVAFATAPGTVAQDGTGANSPFTAALLKRIETAGLELRRLIAGVRTEVREMTQGRQIPWENSALEGDFFFKQATPSPAANTPAVDRDVVFWNSISNSRDPADFTAYLTQFPQGAFAQLARNRLAQLQAALTLPSPLPVPPASTIRDTLLTRLAAMSPQLSQQSREDLVRNYEQRKSGKALAIVPGTTRSWQTGDRRPSDSAEDRALESCQFYHNQSCALVIVDERLSPEPTDGRWPRRDMPRLRYEGQFDLERIPSVRPDVMNRSDVAGYRAAPAPKAAAFHPQGRLFTITGATTQRAAEEQALTTCNVDPDRKGADGPCYLYAVGDQVVLPQRLKEPKTLAPGTSAARPTPQPAVPTTPSPAPPATPGAPTTAAPTGTPATPPPAAPRETILTRFAAAVPSLAANVREDRARQYELAKRHKAQAVSLEPAGTWRTAEWESAALAEEKVLEGCQIRHGQPCALVAVNDTLQASRPGGDWQRRNMVRVRFEGHFSPERIPVVPSSVIQRADVAAYGLAASPKAMAIHPWGRVFAVTGASTQRAAEEQALTACNGDPTRKGEDGPCYLYAAGNHVILPQRRTEPRAPAKTIAEAFADVGSKGIAERYANDPSHKAIAVQVESGRPARWWKTQTAAYAEQSALEACQLLYGTPCVLVAVDDNLRAPDPYSAPRREMPRLQYAGTYRPVMVPFRFNPEKDGLLLDYAKLKKPKAMAIRPNGARINTATGATVAEAEAKALAACNEPDPAYPCFLYAVNDKVVLPQRRTEPSK